MRVTAASSTFFTLQEKGKKLKTTDEEKKYVEGEGKGRATFRPDNRQVLEEGKKWRNGNRWRNW